MSINSDSAVPLYIQIKAYILKCIDEGVFPENSRIPSERQLAEQFDVSRLTVTKALNELALEGVLQARVGRGTFVRARKIDQQLNTLTGFTQDMAQRGQTAKSRVLQATIAEASHEVATALHLAEGAAVVFLERLRLADDEPIAIERASLPADRFPDILTRHNFQQESLYAVLQQEYACRMTSAYQRLNARLPNLDEQKHLKIAENVPILDITRTTYDGAEMALEYVRAIYRGDRYTFTAVLQYGD